MAEKNKKAPKEEKKHLTAEEYFKPHRNALTPEMTALMNDVRAWKEYVRDKINALKTDFKKKDCDKVLILAKLKKVDVVAEKYQELDKIRIETDSYKQRNYRIIFGVVVLLTGVLIVATINKK